MRQINIQPGQKFGRLKAERFSHKGEIGKTYWHFVCDCGNIFTTRVHSVKNGATKSCGCLIKEKLKSGLNRKHSMTKAAEHRIWRHMRDRCYRKSSKAYPQYGGRGISICERWKDSFENFYADMGNRPTVSHSIDRKDNNGNYEPGNCYWATKKQQSSNRRVTPILEYQGTRMTLMDAAKRFHINASTLRGRLKRGMSVSDAVEFDLYKRL